jgi:hypothetical protein
VEARVELGLGRRRAGCHLCLRWARPERVCWPGYKGGDFSIIHSRVQGEGYLQAQQGKEPNHTCMIKLNRASIYLLTQFEGDGKESGFLF